MKRKNKGMFLLISGLILSSSTAFGADIYNVQYDLEKSAVTISGKVTKPSEKVTLEVLQPGVETKDLSNAVISELDKYIYRVDETESDDEGNFEFNFAMKAKTGNYITRIYTGQIDEDVLMYVSYDEYTGAFDEINSAVTSQQVLDVIESKGKLLGMANEYYTKLSDTEKEKVASRILLDKNKQKDKKFEDSKSLLKSYNSAAVLETISNKEEVSTEIIDEYKELFGISQCSANKLYEAFSEKEKTSLVESLKGDTYSDADDFLEAFIEKTVLLEIKNADNYKEIYEVLKDNNDTLKLNISSFEKLSEYNKSLVLKKITGNSYKSTESLKTAFSDAISSVKKSDSTGGGGGKSSSASGSPASGKFGVSITELPSISKQEEKEIFDDLGNVEWAKKHIVSLYEKGIVSGKEKGKFYPMDFVKREEFVKMLVSGLGIDTVAEENTFNDVDNNMWYAQYVLKASKKGIVSGIGNNNFGIGLNITRQDLVTILYRAAKTVGIEFPDYEGKTFADENNISDYAKSAVKALASVEIINGNEYGEFLPQKNATRAEAAKILDAFLDFAG